MNTEYREILLQIVESSATGCEAQLYHFPLPSDSDPIPLVSEIAFISTKESDRLKKIIKGLEFSDQPPKKEKVIEAGKILRKLLFPKAVWKKFEEVLDHAEKDSRHLRIRLLIESDNLKSYPWETVYIEERDSFLVYDDLISLTRLLSTETPLIPLAPVETLRVLVIGCNLGDESMGLLPLPKVPDELKTIQNALDTLRKEGLAYDETMFNPTTEEVELKLMEGWHVVFYTGHAMMKPLKDEGFLLLSDGKGRAAPWFLHDVADSISKSELTRLFILSCCEVGKPACEALIDAGLRSVLAMQFILSDRASVTGSEVLFRAFANRLSLDEALQRYRIEAGKSYVKFAENCTPLLFLQASDGLLFANPEKLAKGNYFRFLGNRYAFMKSLDPAKPLRMKDFYVTLRLGKEIEKIPRAQKDVEERENVMKDFRIWQERAEATERRLEPVLIDDLLKKKRRVVVEADPGAGKTTLTEFLCFSKSRQFLSEGLPERKRSIPVLVELEELSKLEKEKTFISYLENSLSGSGLPADFVETNLKAWLKNGDCLVLFDGLDEVTENRKDLISRLQTLVTGLLRNCTVLLTTRIVGYANELSGWEHYELLSFQDEDIDEFVGGYFAMEVDKGQRLIEAIRQSSEIKTLATNPLLLKLMCYVFERENLTLPQRRIDLYDRATYHMLELRKPTIYHESEKRTVLEAIALHFFEQGQEIIDEGELVEVVRRFVRKGIETVMGEKPSYREVEERSEGLLKEIIQKSGLLYQTSGGRYTFLHLTFQEYFAACALARTKKRKFLDWSKGHWLNVAGHKACLFDPRWEEVLRLLAAKVSDATAMIKKIQNGPDDILRNRLRLAAKCVGEAKKVELRLAQKLCHEVIKAWEEHFTKIDDGLRVLGSSSYGTEMIEFLTRVLLQEEKFHVLEQAAVALARIGTEEGLRPLIRVLMLKDEFEHIDAKICAGVALWGIGSEEAVKPFIWNLEDRNQDINVRLNAAKALGEFGSEGAGRALISVLMDENEDINIRSCAASALGRIDSEDAVKPLVRVLKDKNEHNDVRSSAAMSLGWIGSEKAVRPLIWALGDKNEHIYVRSSAVHSLGRIGSERAVSPLIRALRDEDHFVRWYAAKALGEIGSERAVSPLIEAMKDEEDRVGATLALEQIARRKKIIIYPDSKRERIKSLRKN